MDVYAILVWIAWGGRLTKCHPAHWISETLSSPVILETQQDPGNDYVVRTAEVCGMINSGRERFPNFEIMQTLKFLM